MDFIDLRTKATELKATRGKAFRGFLKGLREHQQAEVEEINDLINKSGDRSREDAKAAMQEQVDVAMQRAKAAVEAAYTEQHEVAGMDEHTRRSYKKLLNGLID